jgi:hypothetical protein
MSRLVEESPRHRPFVDSLSATRHRFARGCGAALEMLARERISTGRQNHRLPARATTRCWITPIWVTPASWPLRTTCSTVVPSARGSLACLRPARIWLRRSWAAVSRPLHGRIVGWIWLSASSARTAGRFPLHGSREADGLSSRQNGKGSIVSKTQWVVRAEPGDHRGADPGCVLTRRASLGAGLFRAGGPVSWASVSRSLS